MHLLVLFLFFSQITSLVSATTPMDEEDTFQGNAPFVIAPITLENTDTDNKSALHIEFPQQEDRAVNTLVRIAYTEKTPCTSHRAQAEIYSKRFHTDYLTNVFLKLADEKDYEGMILYQAQNASSPTTKPTTTSSSDAPHMMTISVPAAGKSYNTFTMEILPKSLHVIRIHDGLEQVNLLYLSPSKTPYANPYNEPFTLHLHPCPPTQNYYEDGPLTIESHTNQEHQALHMTLIATENHERRKIVFNAPENVTWSTDEKVMLAQSSYQVFLKEEKVQDKTVTIYGQMSSIDATKNSKECVIRLEVGRYAKDRVACFTVNKYEDDIKTEARFTQNPVENRDTMTNFTLILPHTNVRCSLSYEEGIRIEDIARPRAHFFNYTHPKTTAGTKAPYKRFIYKQSKVRTVKQDSTSKPCDMGCAACIGAMPHWKT